MNANGTIILGYPDANRLGAATVVSGLNVSVDDQNLILSNAAELHEFPTGIKFLEQYVLGRPIRAAGYISEEVKTYVQSNRQKQLRNDLKILAVRTITVSEKKEARRHEKKYQSLIKGKNILINGRQINLKDSD